MFLIVSRDTGQWRKKRSRKKFYVRFSMDVWWDEDSSPSQVCNIILSINCTQDTYSPVISFCARFMANAFFPFFLGYWTLKAHAAVIVYGVRYVVPWYLVHVLYSKLVKPHGNVGGRWSFNYPFARHLTNLYAKWSWDLVMKKGNFIVHWLIWGEGRHRCGPPKGSIFLILTYGSVP